MQLPMFVMGSPCLLTVQQRMSETILLKICQCFECLEVLAHIRITTGCLFTEIWLKSAVVAALDAKWITSYSSATLLPDFCRLPAGNIGQIEKLMPCATLPRIYMVQQRGTMSSSKNQNASSWSDSSILLMRNLF